MWRKKKKSFHKCKYDYQEKNWKIKSRNLPRAERKQKIYRKGLGVGEGELYIYVPEVLEGEDKKIMCFHRRRSHQIFQPKN